MPRPEHLFFSPVQLIDFTRFYAAEVASGHYPFVEYDENERWHQRIYRDGRVDVWLISWLPTQGTQLHDHGGSAGSFTVLSGTLTEAVVTGGRSRAAQLGGRQTSRPVVQRDNERHAGQSVGFGPHYVHDVRNTSDAPAVSLHAYSPPLTTMTYYDIADGRLDTIASLATEDPEPQFTARGRAPADRSLAVS